MLTTSSSRGMDWRRRIRSIRQSCFTCPQEPIPPSCAEPMALRQRLSRSLPPRLILLSKRELELFRPSWPSPYILRNVTKSGAIQKFGHLVFRCGPGSVLENASFRCEESLPWAPKARKGDSVESDARSQRAVAIRLTRLRCTLLRTRYRNACEQRLSIADH